MELNLLETLEGIGVNVNALATHVYVYVQSKYSTALSVPDTHPNQSSCSSKQLYNLLPPHNFALTSAIFSAGITSGS
jgi:hypothetical protein